MNYYASQKQIQLIPKENPSLRAYLEGPRMSILIIYCIVKYVCVQNSGFNFT